MQEKYNPSLGKERIKEMYGRHFKADKSLSI